MEYFDGFDGAKLALHRFGPKVGSRRSLVLLHGLFSNAEMNWVKWGHAALLAEAGFEVLMPDLRAHGHSAAPHDPDAYPPDVLARDLAALIAHLGLTDYDLGGFSLGSRTSVRGVIGGLRPRQLVLGGMGLEGLTGGTARRDFFVDAIDRFDAVKNGDPAYFAVQFMKSMAVDRVAARLLLSSMADTPADELAAVNTPTLVVCGDQDRDNGSPDKLLEALPRAELAVIPGTHMSCVTKPDLGLAIRDFLAKQPSSRT
jgi:pimeloyl-ACP methyl ester carboxylesterase